MILQLHQYVLIHSSINRHLGIFLCGVEAMSYCAHGVQVIVRTGVCSSSRGCLGTEWLGHVVIVWLLKGTAHVFSMTAAHVTFPPAAWGIPISLHPHQDLSLLVYLMVVILTDVQDLTVVLICIPCDELCCTTFHVLIGHLYLFLGEISIHMLCSFFKFLIGG